VSPSPTKTGTTTSDTRKLSEVARHVVLPSGIVSTGWPAVEAKCVEFGDEFDEWQRGAGKVILAKRATGEYAATVGGITISIPRQVAKTFLVGRIVFALCVLFPGLRVLWTAHRGRTATQTFNKLRGLASRAAVLPYMLGGNIDDAIRASNGEQEIRFANGSIIMFGAREQGFGRGFDEVDVEVFDEAQSLTEKALEDMVAAANQSRHPHGALLFYMGTPPRPIDPGEVFSTRRREALEIQEARDAGDVVEYDGVYIETSADPDADPDDRAQWAKANPSYPLRTPLRSMLRLRKNLVSVGAWLREGLGVWDDDGSTGRAISAKMWTDTAVDVAPTSDAERRALGVAFSLDGMRLSIAGAHIPSDIAHAELIDAYGGSMEVGLAPLADWMAKRWRDYSGFVLSGRAGATVLAELLSKRKVPDRRVVVVNTPQFLQACAGHLDEIKAKTITHLAADGQTALDEAVKVTDKRKRTIDGGWSWTSTSGDHVHVEAVSLALYGARTLPPRRKRGENDNKPKGRIL
jgi:hypothetical protein